MIANFLLLINLTPVKTFDCSERSFLSSQWLTLIAVEYICGACKPMNLTYEEITNRFGWNLNKKIKCWSVGMIGRALLHLILWWILSKRDMRIGGPNRLWNTVDPLVSQNTLVWWKCSPNPTPAVYGGSPWTPPAYSYLGDVQYGPPWRTVHHPKNELHYLEGLPPPSFLFVVKLFAPIFPILSTRLQKL